MVYHEKKLCILYVSFILPEALKDKKETAFFAKIGGSDNYQSVHDKIKAERCNPFDHNDKFNTYEE